MKKIVLLIVLMVSSIQIFSQYSMVSAFPNLTFNNPVLLTHAGDGSNRVYVLEKNLGLIRVFQNDSTVSTAGTFLNVSARISNNYTERGLLGLAFHPNYATNHYFYVFYTKAASNQGDLVIARFTRSVSDPTVADSNSQLVIMTIPHSSQLNHNGGNLMFGQDGYLYIGVGDGGSENDPSNYGQNPNVWLAKVLRIDVDNPSGGNNYGIPAGNLYPGGAGGLPEIYATGMRNPWRFNQDPITGTTYVGDVGQNTWEEIDTLKSGNYGWRLMEGFVCFNPSSGCDTTNKIRPIKVYHHSPECSVTGGYVYRGLRRPELTGRYIYGDYCSGKIWKLKLQGGTLVEDSLLTTAGFAISSFGMDQNGELYVCQFSASGKIYRFNSVVTGIEGNTLEATGYRLDQNYPNPFNPFTSINFTVPKANYITLKVYDVLGKEVQVLVNEKKAAGEYLVNWDASNYPSGVYFYKLTAENQNIEKKMVLIK